mgnify:CR=1 FL=1
MSKTETQSGILFELKEKALKYHAFMVQYKGKQSCECTFLGEANESNRTDPPASNSKIALEY